MRDLGNTVLVVEHDAETIRAADYVIDMGPGAGEQGGEVVFSGPPEQLPACRVIDREVSLRTADYTGAAAEASSQWMFKSGGAPKIT